MTPNALTDSPAKLLEAGKGGEGGDFLITNAEFIAAVFPKLPEGAFAAVCSKSGDPVSIAKVRGLLYRLARLLGDVNAVEKGKVPQRVERRIVGRAVGRILGRLFR